MSGLFLPEPVAPTPVGIHAKFFSRKSTKNFHPDPAGNFFIAIMIAIENLIRINQTLILIFQPDLAGKISTGP